MEKIINKYSTLCNIKSDINEHLPTLKKYSEECDSIVEMGVRWVVSTWALLAGKPKKLVSIDIKHPNAFGGSLDEIYQCCDEYGIDFTFLEESTLTNNIDECDLLFIDTLHTYSQLSKELIRHSEKAKKYIILHDTELFKNRDEIDTNSEKKGLSPALEEFLSENNHWVIKERFQNNNGLTVLERSQ